MTLMLADHGLPLVALKEQRRDLVISLLDRRGQIPRDTIEQIAAIQNAISAIEAVILDLDGEVIAAVAIADGYNQHMAS
jgi:hypothetical protein